MPVVVGDLVSDRQACAGAHFQSVRVRTIVERFPPDHRRWIWADGPLLSAERPTTRTASIGALLPLRYPSSNSSLPLFLLIVAMRLRVSVCVALCLLVVAPASAQTDPPAVDDDLLDQLVGPWTMTGHVMRDSVRYDAQAEWVLGHQFLRLRMTDVHQPPEYAAHVYIGVDSSAQRYVAHWLDTSGGEASTTLGRGRRKGDRLTFRFEYPDGPFRTTFARQPDGTWRVRMRSQSESGEWQPFAAYTMRPAPS